MLADQFPQTIETQPELLAHHYTEAGLKEQAIPYWQQAGQRASKRSANTEAISHLTKGLELLKTLPDTPEHTQQELTLQLALGTPLMATKGYTAPEVESVYARTRELCRQVGETPQLFPVLWGLNAFSIVGAKYQASLEIGAQLLRLAQNVRDPALLVEAHHGLGQTLFLLGEFSPSREHFEQGIMLYDPQKHSPHVSGFVQDGGVTCLSFVASVLWLRGYPDQALKRGYEALTLAQELSHPYTLAYALARTASVHRLRREAQATREQVEALMSLSHEQGFVIFLTLGTIVRGWALAEQGQRKEGIVQIGQALRAYESAGAAMNRPNYLAALAEAHQQAGQTEEGLAALTEALEVVSKTRECWYEAELYRLKGELLLARAGKSMS